MTYTNLPGYGASLKLKRGQSNAATAAKSGFPLRKSIETILWQKIDLTWNVVKLYSSNSKIFCQKRNGYYHPPAAVLPDQQQVQCM